MNKPIALRLAYLIAMVHANDVLRNNLRHHDVITAFILHITIPEMHHNNVSSGSGSYLVNTNIYSMLHELIFKSTVHFTGAA